MITSKHIRKIIAAMVCLCILTCGFIVYAANTFDTTRVTEYQKRMFGDEILTIDIQVDADEWQSLLNNATAKEWISGDLLINGQRFSAVGIRTKGNSSLMQMGSNGRYSLQFKANRYVKGQTFYGLDTFCVNNMMGDATYMKDYISYDIMDFIGVESPLKNYAKVTVNGEDYGFGVALERYDKAFLDRVYNTAAGQLYNVKIGMGRRGDFEDMWQNVENVLPGGRFQGGMELPNRERGGDPGAIRVIGLAGVGGGVGGGGSLVYTDDDISSYGAIFDNAVFSSVSDNEKQRVITALENLSAGTDLEKYFDVDATLRYFAAHTVVVNLDSYTSNMQQNFFLYERDGKITILPWDYNLAFGGFMSGSASDTVNFPIDTPVSGVNMEDRPLLNMLLSVDEYRARYHEYLWQIVEGYFESGLFEKTVNELDAKINGYVRNDVNVFNSYERYTASLQEFIEFGRLRAKSIRGQLEGTIPSTSSGQAADGSSLIDASGIDLSVLGSMMGGVEIGRGGRPAGDAGQVTGPGGPDFMITVPADGSTAPGGMPGGPQGFPGGFGMMVDDSIDMGLIIQAMQILMEAGGELTDDVRAELTELGLTDEQIEMVAEMQIGPVGGMGPAGRVTGGNMPNTTRLPDDRVQGGGPAIIDGSNPPSGGNTTGGGPGVLPDGPINTTPGRGAPGTGGTNSMPVAASSEIRTGYIILIAVSLVLLAGAIIFVAKPRRDNI